MPLAGPGAAVTRSIASNVIWNWAGMGVSILAGFIVAPCLVRGLGDTGYGFWVLIGSFTGAFGLLDLGVRSSIGRNVAFLRSRGDYDGVNGVLSTALAALSVVAVLAVASVWLLEGAFFRLFEVPLDQAGEVRAALLIVGLNLGLTFPANVFDAVLWAGQRFDTINRIDIPMAAARTASAFLIMHFGYGIVFLAASGLLITGLGGALKAVASFRHDRRLAVRVRFVTIEAANCLYGYGVWVFLVSVAGLLLPQIGPVVIGSQLAVAMVTPFSIASRLLAYANQTVNAATGVLTPVMAGLRETADKAKFRELFLQSTVYCFTLAMFFCGLLIVLGPQFVTLWMGERIAKVAGPLLQILAIGELMPMSQSITCCAVLGMGRHRFLAVMSVVQLAVSAGAALILAGACGLPGVAVGLAISASLCRGLIQAVSPCRILDLSARIYVTQCIGPPIASGVAPTALLALMTWLEPPQTWLTLVTFAAVYSLTFFSAALLLPAYADLRGRLRGVADQLRACWSW